MLIEIVPTWKCNLNCKMCNIPSSLKEAPLKDFLKYFDKNKINSDFLVFTGGEPTIRPDFIDFISKIRNKINPTFTTICSNLTMKDRSLQLAKEFENKNVLISTSIDGDKDIHNSIRRNKFAFQKTIDAIKSIRKTYPGMKLNITMTLMYENKDRILYIYSLSRKLGVSFTINLAYPLDFSSFTKEDKEKIVEDLRYVLKKEISRATIMDSHMAYLLGYFEQVIKIIKLGYDDGVCKAGNKYIIFGADGSIHPCSLLLRKGIRIGDIYNTKIEDIKHKACNDSICKQCFENSKYNSRLTKIKSISCMAEVELIRILSCINKNV